MKRRRKDLRKFCAWQECAFKQGEGRHAPELCSGNFEVGYCCRDRQIRWVGYLNAMVCNLYSRACVAIGRGVDTRAVVSI